MNLKLLGRFLLLFILFFLVSCKPERTPVKETTTFTPTRVEATITMPPKQTETLRPTSTAVKEIPSWCNQSKEDNIPERTITWENKNMQPIISQLSLFVNETMDHKGKLLPFIPFSLNGEWARAGINGSTENWIMSTKNKEVYQIQVPQNSGFKFLNLGPWASDNSAVIYLGKKNGGPYDSIGILIVEVGSFNEISTHYFLLPNELETRITPIWSYDSSKIGLFYFAHSPDYNTYRYYLSIIDIKGSLLKTYLLPGSVTQYSSNVFWEPEGLFYETYFEDKNRNTIQMISTDSPELKITEIYSSELPIELLGVNSDMHQILVNEGSSEKSCLRVWDYENELEEYGVKVDGRVIKSESSPNLVRIRVNNDELIETLMFDWQKGFYWVKDDYQYPLGWNSQVNGFLFTKGEPPNAVIGFVSPN